MSKSFRILQSAILASGWMMMHGWAYGQISLPALDFHPDHLSNHPHPYVVIINVSHVPIINMIMKCGVHGASGHKTRQISIFDAVMNIHDHEIGYHQAKIYSINIYHAGDIKRSLPEIMAVKYSNGVYQGADKWIKKLQLHQECALNEIRYLNTVLHNKMNHRQVLADLKLKYSTMLKSKTDVYCKVAELQVLSFGIRNMENQALARVNGVMSIRNELIYLLKIMQNKMQSVAQ